MVKLQKVKKETALRGLTIQIEPSLYERLNKTAFDLKVTKRVLIDTAIIKLLDDIEALGCEL